MRNGPDVLAWNSDKTYLRELAVAGVPVVPTTFLTPDDESAAPGGRWRLRGEAFGVGGQPGHGPLRRQRDTARDHAQRLLEAGRTVLVQPYQDSVDIRGATALMFVNGRFSHAARKAALLAVGRPPTTEQVFVTGTTSRHHIGFSSYRRAAGGRRDRRRSRVVR